MLRTMKACRLNCTKDKGGFVKKRVLVAMSGGVDSSAAAVIMQKSGFAIGGGTMNLCGKYDEALDAERVCEQLDVPHHLFEMTEEFRENVIEPFVSEYKDGFTPNPCIFCNKTMKFGAFLEKAKSLGYDAIATGHYAIVEKNEKTGRYEIKKAKDISKDQSYVLYMLTQEQLSSIYLPLGTYSKSEIRGICELAELVTAKKGDSQDICFVPDGDYVAFIEHYTGEKSVPGKYTDIDGNILGEHKGVINYTIGQRKGLGIALGRHIFVLSKDAPTNTVVLGDAEHLFKKTVYVKDVNLVSVEEITDGMTALVKLRYKHTESPAKLFLCDDKRIKVEFQEPQRAPSVGQSAVFYDGDTVIGGGIICG